MNYSKISVFIKNKCLQGNIADIDMVFNLLNDNTELPVTKIIDFYLGLVSNPAGIKQIEYYFFNGTQIQKNYCALFFARRNEWELVNKAYKAGLIDYKQAYSR